jgi:hypothetical protein
MNQEPQLQANNKSKITHDESSSAPRTNGHQVNGNGTTNGHSSSQQHLTSQACIELEQDYSAHNYHPMPVVFSRAQGAHVFDPEGKRYIDCLSAYSAVNQVCVVLYMQDKYLLRSVVPLPPPPGPLPS